MHQHWRHSPLHLGTYDSQQRGGRSGGGHPQLPQRRQAGQAGGHRRGARRHHAGTCPDAQVRQLDKAADVKTAAGA